MNTLETWAKQHPLHATLCFSAVLLLLSLFLEHGLTWMRLHP